MTSDYPNLMLIGKMGAGKTSGAKFLEQIGYFRASIAGTHTGGLRDIATRIWGEDAINDREKLNWLGTAPENDCWLRNLLHYIDNAHWRGSSPVVVDDVRRELEYFALRERGFVSVRINADEMERVDRLKVSGKFQNMEQLDGKWEHGLDLIAADYGIDNDGDPEEFEAELVKILNRERRRR